MPIAPSAQFLRDLRRTEIVGRVRSDARTRGDLLLGVDWATAMDAIDWGQANFDHQYGSLSAEDRVLLYAYWNQPGHVDELAEAFRQMFDDNPPSEPLIMIDLGCGPFTAGLALAGQLGVDERFDYIGVDQSQTMRRFGEELAVATERGRAGPTMNRVWASDVSAVRWTRPPGWRPVLVVVSFLLASPSLDVGMLLTDLDDLLSKIGRGQVTVLYTNSAKAGPNRSYPVFSAALSDAGFNEVVNDVGAVQTERATRNLRYALFHRPQGRILRLGGD